MPIKSSSLLNNIILLKSIESVKKIFVRKKHRLLEKLRNQWGKESAGKRDYSVIERYFQSVNADNREEYIDEDTWYDLNMGKVFEKLDRCITITGKQVLYKILRTYRQEKDLKTWGRFCELLKDNASLREKIQLILCGFTENKHADVVSLFREALPDKPKYPHYIYFSSATVFLSTVTLFNNPVSLFIITFFGIVNIFLRRSIEKKLSTAVINLYHLRKLLYTAEKLASCDKKHEIPLIERLRQNRDFIKTYLKRTGLLYEEEDEYRNVLVQSMILYMNFFLLIDIISFFRVKKYVDTHMRKIEEIYSSVGELDASVSLASYMNSLRYYSLPEFITSNTIDAEDIYHPLLADPVANSFSIHDRSALITGSNMAGKTTFIKTIGLNIIFARTIYLCLARKVRIPEVNVQTLIRREDNILEGASYYFREVRKMRSLITRSRAKRKNIFIIDEIFRGTNTVERIAISTASIMYMTQNNISLITTHDVELQETLKDTIEMYHFSERILNNSYEFDYRIKHGPTDSTNAIRLLELNEFPTEITGNAHTLADSLKKQAH